MELNKLNLTPRELRILESMGFDSVEQFGSENNRYIKGQSYTSIERKSKRCNLQKAQMCNHTQKLQLVRPCKKAQLFNPSTRSRTRLTGHSFPLVESDLW